MAEIVGEHTHSWTCPGPVFIQGGHEGYAVLMPLYCACGEVRLRDAGPPEPHRRRRLQVVNELPHA